MLVTRRRYGNLPFWRIVLWGVLASILAAPLIAMQFTEEVRWDVADFAAGAALLTCLGTTVEFVSRACLQPRTKALVMSAALLALLLVWADAAVGVF